MDDVSSIRRWEDAKKAAEGIGLDIATDTFNNKLRVSGGTSQEGYYRDGFSLPFSSVDEVLAFLSGYKCAMEQKAREDAATNKEER